MMMKVIWNVTKTLSGIVPLTVSAPMCFSMSMLASPMNLFPSPAAKEYPYTTQRIDITAATMKHCTNTERMFLARTSPP